MYGRIACKTTIAYSACGPFTKYRKRIERFGETQNLKHLYRNELDKACFVHDAAYVDSKGLTKGTIYEIPRHREYDDYQRALASRSMVYF